MFIDVEDKNVLTAHVSEDETGQWAVYMVPIDPEEIYLTEQDLRNALREIEALK